MALTWRQEEKQKDRVWMFMCVCVFSGRRDGWKDGHGQIDGLNENAASLYLFSIIKVPNCSQNKHKQR